VSASVAASDYQTTNTTLLSKLADRLALLSTRPLSNAVLSRAKLFLLNGLASAFEGRSSPDAKFALRYAASFGGSGRSVLWLTGDRVAPADATFANCVSLHGSIKEDTHTVTPIHPGTPVIPAALALADHVDANGLALAKALVVGFEAMCQVARLVSGPVFNERGWRHTAVFGGFGTAAAGSVLLGLDRGRVVSALALAGNAAGGLNAYKTSGSSDHAFSNGNGARSGVQAVLLAGLGFSGSANLLEDSRGFLVAFASGVANAKESWPVDDGPEILNTFLKKHESARANQEAIEATKRIVDKHHPAAADIDRVQVVTHRGVKAEGRDNPGPYTGHYSRMVSCQFGVAAVLLDGWVTHARLGKDDTPGLLALTHRISLETDAEADRAMPDVRIATVTVHLRDGRKLVERVENVGDIGFEEISSRFFDAAEPAIGDRAAKEVIELVAHLEGVGSTRDLTDTLKPLQPFL